MTSLFLDLVFGLTTLCGTSRVFLPTGLNKSLVSGSGLPSGLSGLPLGTARIQIPNENGQCK
jgi:hypothetical protein